MTRIIPPVIWVVVFLAIGFAIGQITSANMGWYDTLNKPVLTPPDFVFPIAWSAIYVLLALCGWNVFSGVNLPNGRVVFGLFWVVMALNWGWSFIFFGGQMICFALAWIMALNLANLAFIGAAWSRHRVAALLMLPHLLWCLFATYLNYAIWALN